MIRKVPASAPVVLMGDLNTLTVHLLLLCLCGASLTAIPTLVTHYELRTTTSTRARTHHHHPHHQLPLICATRVLRIQ